MKKKLKDKDVIILIIVIIVIIIGIITLAFVKNHNQKENEKATEQEKQEFEQYIADLHNERENIDKKAQEKIDFLDSLNSENASKLISKFENQGYKFNYREDNDNYSISEFYNVDGTIDIRYTTLTINDSNTLEMTFLKDSEYYSFYKNYYTNGLDDNLSNSENGFELYSNWLKEMNITQDELINLLFCTKLMEYKTN